MKIAYRERHNRIKKLYKDDILHMLSQNVFSSEFWEIFKNAFLIENTPGGCFCLGFVSLLILVLK